MALESRPDGLYYYAAEKIDGRVVKRYIGAGQDALLAAQAAQDEREARQAAQHARAVALAAFEAQDADLDDLCQRTERLAQGVLLGAGYRRHDRGEWRRRR